MMRFAWLMLPMLAGCAARPLAPPPAAPAMCRVGPDGGRPVADRGIGGTGAPPVHIADRGIGGTGIIGVITGFASVCVAGEEVALPDGVAARIDDQPGGLADLRAGQVVALAATGARGSLQAQVVAVRHDVIGPVDSSGAGTLTVAGQVVLVAGATGSAVAARPGAWVAVSGLRQPDGAIAATRIDPAMPGQVLVRGELVRVYDTARIGALAIRLPDEAGVPGGWPATVSGRLEGGVLMADSAVVDTAAESPSAYFGPTVASYIVESYVAVVAGGYLVDRDFVTGSGFGTIGTRGRSIATFTRGSGGGLTATGLRGGGDTAPSGSGFITAPVPRGNPGGAGGYQPTGSFAPGQERGGFGPRGFAPGNDGGPTGPPRRP